MFLPLDRVEISIASAVISAFSSSSATLSQNKKKRENASSKRESNTTRSGRVLISTAGIIIKLRTAVEIVLENNAFFRGTPSKASGKIQE